MAITSVRRVENRSRSSVVLLERTNGNVANRSSLISPGTNLAVDRWIPWAVNAGEFAGKHLELQMNGVPRFAIWQAAKGDGDFVRFSTDRAWHDPGEHIFGVAEVNGFRTLRVMDRYCSLLPHALPVPLEHVTSITRVENHSQWTVTLLNTERQNVAPLQIGPGQVAEAFQVIDYPPFSHLLWQIDVPFAGQAADFPGHHLQIRFDGQPRFWLWQASSTDGELVRFSTAGLWHEQGEPVHGLSGANGRRTLVINENGCFQLMAQDVLGMSIPDLQGLLGMGDHHFCEEQPGNPHQDGLESVPKRSAVAFSVAGPPSDAFDRGERGARFLYRDSGKRYDFRIDEDGIVVATHPDGRTTPLTRACSFTQERAGDETAAPPFDLIAASGGRVFAKAKGQDQFYFSTMDHLFIHAGRDGKEFPVPSTYFKLDPEFNQPDANDGHLTKHISGCYGDHPAVERFPQLFWPLLEQNVMDAMIARVDRWKWHLIDARPPLSRLNPPLVILELYRRLLMSNPINVINPIAQVVPELVKALLSSMGTQDDAKDPPVFLLEEKEQPEDEQVYDHVKYCRSDLFGAHTIALRSIKYRRVLDIGVGHVHWHEQYQRVTGGELQPMRSGRLLNHNYPHLTWMDLYRLASGPIRDGDGFIDGTCNYYALVQIKPDGELNLNPNGGVEGVHPDAFAILYADEQFYFTQRWRLVHPDDHRGLMTALVKGLQEDPDWHPVFQRPLYGWNSQTYWCPFRAGHIGLKSRMAVAAQVLLVTGGDPPDAKQDVIYSINFSYSTMDRTWRWRALPGKVCYFNSPAERWDESIQPNPAIGPRTVYPETVRLREDMTIHVKGTKDDATKPGRWYQRYLPAGNLMPPVAPELVPRQRPRVEFTHPWKFLGESVFTEADRFSHFGVYDTVDSRTQYYHVEPASDADTWALAANQSGAWVDEGGQLFVDAWKFPWHGGSLRWEARRPPSLFEPVTRLRIVKRGPRWIAMHWDKRDDDLIPFTGLPKTVMLTNGTDSAKVTIGANVWFEEAPGVRRAHFWWEGTGTTRQAAIAFTAPTVLHGREIDNLWRVRMAALKFDPNNPSQPTQVVSLLNVETAGRFTRTATGYYEYRWTPDAADLPDLEEYCSAAGEADSGCSMWFEDLVGHVSVPDEMRWLPPPTMTVTINPSSIPLNVLTQVTVTAVDVHTGANLKGTVAVDDVDVGSTGVPFSYLFTPHVEEISEPIEETSGPVIRVPTSTRTIWVNPVLTVSVPDYPDARLTPRYYSPTLQVRVEPSAIPIGRAVQVVVRTTDASSGAPVAGRVTIGGRDVGGTNVPFTYTFTATPASGLVTASGYPDRTVAFSLYSPQQRVTVEAPYLFIGRPSQLTVRSLDANTGAPVAGRVILNGQDVVATNTPFTYTFGSSPPSGVVRSPAYPDAGITWPALRTPQLAVSIQPYPVRTGTVVTYTVRAVDADTQVQVDGAVMVGSTTTPIARTNVPFPYTFRLVRQREFDPEVRIYFWTSVPPVAFVSAAGYATVPLDLGL